MFEHSPDNFHEQSLNNFNDQIEQFAKSEEILGAHFYEESQIEEQKQKEAIEEESKES